MKELPRNGMLTWHVGEESKTPQSIGNRNHAQKGNGGGKKRKEKESEFALK
jgi:hypothetical protein